MDENSDGASLQQIANDLGINRVTLKNWINKFGAYASTNTNEATVLSEAEQIRQLKKENGPVQDHIRSGWPVADNYFFSVIGDVLASSFP